MCTEPWRMTGVYLGRMFDHLKTDEGDGSGHVSKAIMLWPVLDRYKKWLIT